MEPEEVEENLEIEDFAALEQGNVKALFDQFRVEQDFDIELVDEDEEYEIIETSTPEIPEAPVPMNKPMDVELPDETPEAEPEPTPSQPSPTFETIQPAEGTPVFQPLAEEQEESNKETVPIIPSEPAASVEDFKSLEEDNAEQTPPSIPSVPSSQADEFKPLEEQESPLQEEPRPPLEAPEEKEIKRKKKIKKPKFKSVDASHQVVKPYLDPDLEEHLYLEGDDKSFLESLKDKWKMYRHQTDVEEESYQQIGIDITAPKKTFSDRINSITGHSEIDRSDFEQLLTPLSGSDLAILRSEISQDETIFSTIQSAKNKALVHHYMGIMFGLLMWVFFVISVGKEYFTETLPNLGIPTWLPDTVSSDIASGGLYVIGLLVPIFTIFVFSYGVRELFSMIEAIRNHQFRVDDLLLTLAAAVCGFGALFACGEGNVISGLVFLVIYFIILWFAKILGVRT